MNERDSGLLRRIALAIKLLEQKQPGDTVDMAPSPAEPPAPEAHPHMPGFSKEVSDALKVTHMGEEALSDSRVRSGAYLRRWGTLNGLCVRYCAAFQSGEGIPRAEAELTEYVRWLIAAGVVKP